MAMLVLTPSYAADLDLFAQLHESVLACFPPSVSHLVVTPERDVGRFRTFEGPRCSVVSVREVLPQRLWPVPSANAWVNPRRPFPPVRGWIMQQLVKLAVATQASERVIVLADADVAFVRPVDEATFAPGGGVRFYRRPEGVDASLSRHLRWHEVARRLLGLPEAPPPPLADYISALNTWDGELVRSCLRRVEEVGGRPWLQQVAAELHVSEFILYGVHADHTGGPDIVATGDPLCLFHWDTEPLDEEGAAAFAARLSPSDVAVMISAKSNTPLEVRRRVVDGLRR